MIKRQKKLIIIFAIIVAVLAVGYFAVLTPILNYFNKEEAPEPIELLPGEVLDSSDRILLFEHIERAHIKQVDISNASGSWSICRGEDDDFYIKDHKSVPYDSTLLSSLVVSAGYTLSMTRVTTECTDWAEYGLDEENRLGWYTITTTSDVEHTVYIGSKIPTGGGYYCSYKDRDAVYVLSTDLVSSLLISVNEMVYPILTYPTGTNDYYLARDFFIMRGDEMFVWIDYNEDSKTIDKPTTSTYIMNYPASYVPNTTNYSNALSNLTELVGLYVMEIGDESLFDSENSDGSSSDNTEGEANEGADDDAPTPGTLEYMYESVRQIRIMSHLMFGRETLEKYDLLEPAYTFHYRYNDVDSFVLFSDIQESGEMYAYSSLWNTIVLVDPSEFEFLRWDLLSYVDKPLFMLNISDIAEIKLESENFSETFSLSGESTELKVIPESTGEVFDEYYLYNFRQFYKSVLTLSIEDYTDEDKLENCVFTLTMTTRKNRMYEYKFYRYSTRRCYYTVNGEGEFYVLYDMVEKIINDCQKVLAGQDVDSWAKN